MPQGKPAGVACVQLAPDLRCRLFGDALRPRVCAGLKPAAEICGYSRDEALRLIADLETRTAP